MEAYIPYRQTIVAEPSQHMDETHKLFSEIQKAMFNLSFELMKLPLFKNLNTQKNKFHQLLDAYDDFKQRFEQLKQIDLSKLSSEQRNIQRSYIIEDNMLEFSANTFDPYYNLSPVLDSKDIEQFEDLLSSRSVFYQYMQFQLSQMRTLIATSEKEKFNRFKQSLNQYKETLQFQAINHVLNEKNIGISKVCGALEEFLKEFQYEVRANNQVQNQVASVQLIQPQNLPPLAKPDESKLIKCSQPNGNNELGEYKTPNEVVSLSSRSEEVKYLIENAEYVGSVQFIEEFKKSMIFLMEMGFMDYMKNRLLLIKYKGNMNAVVNALLLGL